MRHALPKRWLALAGDGAIKWEGLHSVAATPPRPGGIGQPRNHRIAVSAISRVVSQARTRAVRIVGVSATTALILSPQPVGHVGQCVDVFLPVVGNREIRVTAGIVSSDEVGKGHALLLHFIIADVALRQQLNELVALLLAGDADAAHKQPRVIYDVAVRYGARGERVGHLQELSLTDLSLRTDERLPNLAPVRLTIPAFSAAPSLVLDGCVAGQRLSREGGYHTTIRFDALDDAGRRALSELIADVMCR